MNPYYQSDATRLLDRHFIDAIEAARKVDNYLKRCAEGVAAVSGAKQKFIETFSDKDAGIFIEAETRGKQCESLIAAIEASGGPIAARDRVLYSSQVFSTLETGLGEKAAAIGVVIESQREALATRRAELTKAGVGYAIIETSAEVIGLRQKVEQTESHLRTVNELRSYCGPSWSPKMRQRHGFSDIFGTLQAPL